MFSREEVIEWKYVSDPTDPTDLPQPHALHCRTKFYEFDMKPTCKRCYDRFPTELKKRISDSLKERDAEIARQGQGGQQHPTNPTNTSMQQRRSLSPGTRL